MPYSPVAVPGFGGLILYPDPQEVGTQNAVDLLNVDLDLRGRVRSRDGFAAFTASAAASRLNDLTPFYKANSTTRQLLTSSNAGSFYRAYSTAGAIVADQSLGVSEIFNADFTRFGGPSAEVSYATSSAGSPTTNSQANDVYKWDGAAWTAATGVRLGGAGNYPMMLDVVAAENRLVGAFVNSASSRVGFSGAGTPETWGANDYVDLTPGDGERITAIVSWRELVVVFKKTKYFVFTGSSVDGTGNPVFNYRPVNTGVGAIARLCATATPNGVYFLSARGIYRTTGADPVLVSRDIDPIFRGSSSSLYLGGVVNHAAIEQCRLAWHDERLFFSYPSGSATVNDRTLVFDPETNQWLLWDLAPNSMTSFRVGDAAELVFTYASGSNHIGRHSSAYTTDDGTAITSRYQSGFYELGQPGQDTYTRYTRLWGSGAPTLSVFTDYGTTDAVAAAVTLGTSPTVAEGYHQKAYKGRLFSHKLSGTTPWLVSNLQHDVAWARS
jgi:hypothetical protein